MGDAKVKKPRRKVVWDEDNLAENEEYQRQNPVTLHITEPDTPYCFDRHDSSDEEETNWDAEANQYIKGYKEELLSEKRVPAPSCETTGKPQISISVVSGEEAEKQTREDFNRMRKAVYADEGKAFRAKKASMDQ